MDKKNIFGKIRTEYLVVALLLVVCVWFALSSFTKNDDSTKDDRSSYTTELENRLSKALSKVNGAGKVSVVITVSGGSTTVLAEDRTVTTENGVRTEKTSTVLVGGKPVVLKENYPEIMGVLVVAKGADRFDVRMALLDATTTVLNVSADKVQILAQ